MNAERLSAIAHALRDELQSRNVTGRLTQLLNSLRQLSQSSNPTTQQSFAANRNDFLQSITDTESDWFSGSWRQVMAEMRLESLFGKALKNAVETLLDENIATPAVAIPTLEKLQQDLEKTKIALDQLVAGFGQFFVGSEQLSPGECEIGILIPRKEVKNQLSELTSELKKWRDILEAFSEVSTGGPDNLEIRTLSSSELLIYLTTKSTEFAACVAKAVGAIVGLIKNTLEIRRIYRESKQTPGIPPEVAEEIMKSATKSIDDGLEKVTVEIMAEFYQTGRGNKHELQVKVNTSLKRMARRMDRGFSVDVRVGALPEGSTEKTKQDVRKIQAESANMQYLNLGGEPILALPESVESGEDPKPVVARKPRSPRPSKQQKNKPTEARPTSEEKS